MEVKEDLTLETRPVKIMDQSEKTLRNKRVSLVRVLWRNSQIEEEMWEREAQIKEKYPHLFLKNVKYTKRGRFIIIQNVCIIQKKKKEEKDGAKMELIRDGTINTHPFSHPWRADNKKKEGGEFHIFPSSKLGVNT